MSQATDLPQTLTRRYVLALVLLAALATAALVGANVVISRQEGYSAAINISGRQRMRSQRAVLYAERLPSQSAAVRENARRELLKTTQELAQRHEALSQATGELGLPRKLSPVLERIYSDGPDTIDPLLKTFLAASRAVLAKSASGPIAKDDPDLVLMSELGTNQLLVALDRAVSHYEADSENAIDYLRVFEFVIWIAGLLVLLGAGLLIFAPMVRRLQQSLNEMEALNAALTESEERFVLSAKGASVGIRDHFNPRQDAEYWSPQLYHLLGYVPGELESRTSVFNNLVHPNDRQRFHEAIARHLQEHDPLEVKCRLQHKTHGYRWFLVTGQAKWDAEGVPQRLITTIKDIDDSVQAEELKAQFISTVSHELRTPLTSIMGALGLMRTSFAAQLSAKAQQLVTIAYDNCERLIRLINDLLDVEKMEAGKVAFDFKPESLVHLLEKAREQNELFAERFGASIVVEPVEHDVIIEVDEVRFAQVMANLLSNAAKYSPPRGVITIATQFLDGAVRISVSDQGPGVPDEFRHRIFERFAQADAPDGRKKGGTGLGLNIAKAIVEAHDGTIGFDSEPGKGATFYFQLPVAHAVPAGADADTERADVIGLPLFQSERSRRARSLLVLNDAAACAAAVKLIGDISEVTAAATCREAGRLLSRRAFDLVILDRDVVDEDARRFLQILSDRGHPVPPVLAYDAAEGELPPWRDSLAAIVKETVTQATLRQAVLDALRCREEQLATRFKKSA